MDPLTNRRTTWLPGEALFFIGIWATLLIAGRQVMLRDPGTYWHTVAGRLMLETHRPLTSDPFCFAPAGRPWIAQQWLAECLMAMVDRLSGLDGLLVVSAAVVAGVFAFAARRILAAGLVWPVAVTWVAMGIAASSYHFLARPHLASLALMAWVFALMCDVGAGQARTRCLWALPLLFALWTNLHGAALGGLATVWLIALGWVVDGWLTWRRPVLHQARPPAAAALLAALASTAACLLNPYGTGLIKTWWALSSADWLPRTIIEHAPADFTASDGWMLSVLAAGYGWYFVRNVRHIDWRTSRLVPLVWFALSLQRVRHGPLFAVITLLAVADIAAARRASAMSAEGWTEGPPPPQPSWARAVALPLVLVAMALMLQHFKVKAPLIGAGWARVDPAYCPTGLTACLRLRAADGGAAARVINDLRFGGYLPYFVPEARSLIDDRCELHGAAGIGGYLAGLERPPLIDEWAETHDAATALVVAGGPLDRWLSRRAAWRRLCGDDHAVVYARSDPAPAAAAH